MSAADLPFLIRDIPQNTYLANVRLADQQDVKDSCFVPSALWA